MKMKTVHIPVITHSRTFGNDLFNFPENNKNSEPNLNLLIPESHSPGSINCKWADCGKFFKYLDDLASHVSTFHSNSGPGGLFYCRWDGCTRGERGFNARYKMLVHVRTHTNEKPHQCFQCHKSFSRAENLKIHARSHTGERPYVCPVPGCGKAYSNSSDRFKHTRTHSVHKPYVCKMPSCGKSYTDPSSLRKHVKTYRHYLTAFGPADENSPRKINAEEANGAEDRVENQRHCDIENAENGLPFAVLKKWLRSDSVFKSFANTTGFQKTDEDFRRGVIYQEQESPLDLTIRK